jgi:ferredoxin-NADP reductase
VLHRNVNLPITVKGVEAETPGYLSVHFERPQQFTFESGDWIDIRLPADQPPGGTVYSLSSSPTESDLRITIREGVSPFKKTLQSLQAGDKLIISDYGNDYGFRLKEHKASTLIAGGVGVAPFRSMIKEMVDTSSRNQAQLIYLNTSDNFLFKDEFDAWQHLLPGLEVHYIATKELKRKDREKLLHTLIPDTAQHFYVSGPSGMVASTVSMLKRFGADAGSIKVDDFGHY